MWWQPLKSLIFPPGINLILAGVGLLVWRRYRRLAVGLLLLSFLSLYLLSLGPVAARLHHWLEPAPLDLNEAAAAQLIVVLGGGRYRNQPEYARDVPGSPTLERLHYAAWLSRKTGLPILVSGGRRADEPLTMAEMMAHSLSEVWHIDEVIEEGDSRNTAENALFSARLIKAMGLDTIYLVTHASHARRAVWAFERQGIVVIPAATVFISHTFAEEKSVLDFLPSMYALRWSRIALHEYLGLLYYRLAY